MFVRQNNVSFINFDVSSFLQILDYLWAELIYAFQYHVNFD